MRVTYDPKTGTLTVLLRVGAQIAETDEATPGFILDYDADGNLVSFEQLDAVRNGTEAHRIEFEMTMEVREDPPPYGGES